MKGSNDKQNACKLLVLHMHATTRTANAELTAGTMLK
jgi:hypothetical protein